MKLKGILLLAAAALFAAGQAFAVPINPPPSGEDSLQDILDSITGSHLINAQTDQVNPSAYWRAGINNSVSSVIQFEFAGNKNSNSFGIYDPNDPSNRLTLFYGEQGLGQKTNLDVTGTLYVATYKDHTGTLINPQDPLDHSGAHAQDSRTFSTNNLFGFFLDTPNGTFYSDPSLNPEGSGDQAHHLVVFQGFKDGKLLANEYIFGWEDLPGSHNGWDGDYNDFVVTVESIAPVPEPTALAMFGLGLLGLGFGLRMSRRRRS